MYIDVDNHKLMYHPERVSDWKAKGDCAPVYIEIGPTNKCNHQCEFCALDWLKHGGSDINPDSLRRNLENMADYGVKSVMFAGEGEPLLHKDITSFVQTAKRNKIDVSITSNGVPFTKDKADQILPYLSWSRFSVDAGTPETYSKVHGTKASDFNRVLTNIAYAVEIKRKNNLPVTIGVQALLTRRSIGELATLAKIVKDIGVDNLQVKPYSHHPDSKNDLSFDFREAEELREMLESLSGDGFKVAYRANTIARIQGDRVYTQCYGLPFFALIDSRGNVIPCNLFYNKPEFYFGNINESLFSEIWESPNRKKIIENLNQKGIQDCRVGCRLDPINRYLHRCRNPHPHDNFI